MDNVEFDEARGGYVAAAGTKVAAPFSPLHLALKVRTGLPYLICYELIVGL